jgi:putative transposase
MNQYNPHVHHRRSIRLKGYDYAQAGLYFITICVQNRKCLFGKIAGANPRGCPDNANCNELILNPAGKMIETEWLDLKIRFPHIELHEYVVMPNHFHAILEIVVTMDGVAPNDNDTQHGNINDEKEIGQPRGFAPPTNKTIGDMMAAFKSKTTVEYIRGVKNLGWPPFDGKLWQRNYYEHIIRNEHSYQTIS